ncbi:VWA domain-containing protein [Dokdonia sp. Hel_I_53]|uniref:VWA domain-containing protein n=1 Tax=Dokdonia sp. Hel_I_53 TaxID=1566287 RepID=UPI00119BC7BF|nr:VWA domain-containing protein [Dokdonia sp. Hel_I_53]TVZ52363.1 von Willebrand factor type A domain-containing protein [Dokdonia sp. Hel_I_53]
MKSLTLLGLSILLTISTYAKKDHFKDSAFAKANQSSNAISSKIEMENKNSLPTIRVALLLDTSNSMDGLIDQARAQLWELVNELSYARCGNDIHPELKIALYEYGNDRLDAREGYIRQVNSFSNDLDEISKNLFALTTNGGNEYCGNVILSSLNQLDWGTESEGLNIIFIAGNEPFNQGPVAYTHAVNRACDKDVTVNTIFCGDYNTGAKALWKDAARLSKGEYIAINSDRATVHVSSPYDDRILEKNEELNKTYIGYGALGQVKLQLQSTQDENAQTYGEANAVKRVVTKSSRFYKNSSWDLVDALEENEEIVESINKYDLPNHLKGKTKKELKTYLELKKSDRVEIQEEIATLNLKRKQYVSNKTNIKDNELRNALVAAIKKQGKEKGFVWKQ